MNEKLKRIHIPELHNKIVDAGEAASWIQDGMTVGLSGFTKTGDAKAVPLALVDRANAGDEFKVNVYTGASIGSDIDKLFSEAGIVNKRLPYQGDPVMRKAINDGEHLYTDIHLSHVSELLRSNAIDKIDYAILEAVSITEDGLMIPSTSVGNNLIFAEYAENIIIELNVGQPEALEGVHDIYSIEPQGDRKPIPLLKADERIGERGIPFDMSKVKGIVITSDVDEPSVMVAPDEETKEMANHLLDFLRTEIEEGRLTEELMPLQSGVGSVANAVLHGMLDSEFKDLNIFSEVLQDAVFDLIDAGKVKTASGTSFSLSEEKMKQVYSNFEDYRDHLILRPQDVSNHPEVIRRLGLISINTALEFDIYGNVNSTHVAGTKMMNGLGGSGDFARNARLSIFVTKSVAKGGDISSVVPYASHIDHTEHDVDVVVTEQGFADLRGLAPRERVPLIIENCVHPDYRAQMWGYYQKAVERGGQTPHVIEEAFAWHSNFVNNGTMKLEIAETVK